MVLSTNSLFRLLSLLGNSLFSRIFVKKVKLNYEIFFTHSIYYSTLSFTWYRTM
jgi:hypothetical protein